MEWTNAVHRDGGQLMTHDSETDTERSDADQNSLWVDMHLLADKLEDGRISREDAAHELREATQLLQTRADQ